MALFLASGVALSVILDQCAINVLPAIVLHRSLNAWSWGIPVSPPGGEVRPDVLMLSLLFATAVIVFFKPGPPTQQASSRP